MLENKDLNNHINMPLPQHKKGISRHLRARTREKASRKQRREHNLRLIRRVNEICQHERFKRPSYKYVISIISAEGWQTLDSRNYTERSLYRMLQRMGFSGIYGLQTYSPQTDDM